MRPSPKQNVLQQKVMQQKTPQRNLLIVSMLALTALTGATYTSAQASGSGVIYKSTDKEGRTTYSEKPPTTSSNKAKTVELNIDPNQNILPAEIPRMPASTRSNQNQGGEDDAKNSVADAEAALKAAEQALVAGRETQPGDFSGKSGGGVGPSTQRIERLNQLQADVDRAREALERASSGRN